MFLKYRKIDSETFETVLRRIHDGVFSGRHAHEGPFRNADWEIFLLPYEMNMEQDTFGAISQTAQRLRDNELIIKDFDVHPPELPIAVPWDWQVLEEIQGATDLALVESHGFGRSGCWGLVWTKDDFSCLGGEESFMNTVAELLGGRDKIRERFFNFVTEEWQIPEEFKRKILQMVGW